LANGQTATRDAATTPALLKLEDAVQIAVANNRTLKIATLEIDKSRWQIAEVKTKRLPSLSGTVLGSQLLNEVSFSFPAGSFGSVPGVGPFPTSDTKITTPRQPIAYVFGQVSQPLSQLYKIQLGIRAKELDTKITSEKARAERQSLIKDVKQAYYSVLQSESQLEAAEANVKQYQELDRVVLQRVSQESALPSDSLEVKAKFANENYKLIQLRNARDSTRVSEQPPRPGHPHRVSHGTSSSCLIRRGRPENSPESRSGATP
jgi:outer membrane protein TolC